MGLHSEDGFKNRGPPSFQYKTIISLLRLFFNDCQLPLRLFYNHHELFLIALELFLISSELFFNSVELFFNSL